MIRGSECERNATRYNSIMMSFAPIVLELPNPPLPWDAVRAFAAWPNLVFLDSSEQHPERGHYSYISADPRQLTRTTLAKPGASANPFTDAAAAMPRIARPDVANLPPFFGGSIGLFGYQLAHAFERIPTSRYQEFHTPELVVGFYDWVLAFNHLTAQCWLISTGREPHDADPEHAEQRAQKRIIAVQSALASPPPPLKSNTQNLPPIASDRLAPMVPLEGYPGVWSNFSPDDYRAMVARAIEYIHAGDVFQVNLSQRLLAELQEHPLQLYRKLRERSPAPFAAYWDFGTHQLVSASPERFLSLNNRDIVTRPIKGTRPRGRTPREDAAQLEDLMTNPKDRAENVMIVDLLRNDIGRVAEYGSVAVPKVCEVESYNYVHHLVSEVRGTLREGLSAWDLLAAAFPGGSVTGAPKVRAMEIIAELEPTARGAYCGSMGYISFDGTMDTNILIRTFTAGEGWLQFCVGGGIVADSDPLTEYYETLHKAAGLLRALAP